MNILYIPCPNKEEARSIAKHLLEKKLIACANILPSMSIYSWEGKIKEEDELILLVKTTKATKAKKEILSIHSYELPCVITLEASANEAFDQWVNICCQD